MNLPEQYFPVRICPHIAEGLRYRLMFAECGSYENVNLSIKDKGESISFWPQKSQGSVKNLLNNIPSLPLFSDPLNDKWKEWDSILGMKNYNEMYTDLIHFCRVVQTNRSTLRNHPKNPFSKKVRACSKIIQHCYHNGRLDLSELPADQYKELMETLDHVLKKKYAQFEKAVNACDYGTNCLAGYNRDFYGGNVSIVAADSSKSADILAHAGGTSFQDICITEASCQPGSRLRHARLLDRISLDEPVYQIVSSSLCSDKGLLCARQKHKCSLISSNSADYKLEQKDLIDIPHEFLTSVSFSQHMNNELLVSTKSSSIILWDINSRSKNQLLVKKTQDPNSQNEWSCSYFGGHPRHVAVADTTSVAMFDHRTNFTKGVDLFSLSPSLTKKEERVMAATFVEFPFHSVVTDYAVFIIDQRFPLAPVLNWSSEFISSPQYIQVLHQQNHLKEPEKILFVASQQPSEVMCFPMSPQRNNSPTSPVIPWKLSQIGDFCQSTHTSYTSDLRKTERRFKASLAGIAVSNQSVENSFTVYQVDCYGDIFYQSLVHSPEDVYSLQSCTEEEKQEADKQAESWLRAFEHSAKPEISQLECLSVDIAPIILTDIFRQAPPEITTSEYKPDISSTHPKLHKKLKPLRRLITRGSSTRLHMALKENKDITEFLKKREKDHTSMKRKMRRVNLKDLKEKLKAIKKRKELLMRKKKSSFYCRTDSDTDEDDNIRKKASTNDTNTCSGSQEVLDPVVEERTSTTEDLEMIDGSSSVAAQSGAGCSKGSELQPTEMLDQGDSTQMMENTNSCADVDMSIELLQSRTLPGHRASSCDRSVDETSRSSISISSLSDTDTDSKNTPLVPSKSRSTRLSMAHGGKKGITRCLQEKNPTAKKKKRKVAKKSLKEQKYTKRKRRKISSFYCRTDSDTDDDDNVRKQASTNDTNTCSEAQEESDHIVEERTSTTEDLEMIDGSSSVAAQSGAGCSKGSELQPTEMLDQGDSTQMMENTNSCADVDMSIELLQSRTLPGHRASSCDRSVDETSRSSISISSLSDTDTDSKNTPRKKSPSKSRSTRLNMAHKENKDKENKDKEITECPLSSGSTSSLSDIDTDATEDY